MTTSMKDNTAIEYPKILGIKYRPEDFNSSSSTMAKWIWKTNPDALTEIQQAGGQVRTFDPQNISPISRKILAQELTGSNANRFTAEHLCQPLNGIEITVPAHAHIQKRLDIKMEWLDQLPARMTVVINLEKDSALELQLISNFKETKSVQRMICGKLATNSRLKLVDKVKNTQVTHMLLTGSIHCERDASCDWTLYPKAQGSVLGNLSIQLDGRGSEGYLNVGATGQSHDWLGLQGLIEHHAPQTYSRINMRGVLYQNARVYFTSIGKINKGARGANASQESRLMTVEPQAKGSVNPLLIIDENDVKAGHAASVGQYDEEELYYLLSRGLQPEVAKQILIDDFMNPVMEKDFVEN